MSALGQKQTLGYLQAMSALPPKADIETQLRNVRFVPKADTPLLGSTSDPILIARAGDHPVREVYLDHFF